MHCCWVVAPLLFVGVVGGIVVWTGGVGVCSGGGPRSPSHTKLEGKYPVCPSFSPFHHPSFCLTRPNTFSPETVQSVGTSC